VVFEPTIFCFVGGDDDHYTTPPGNHFLCLLFVRSEFFSPLLISILIEARKCFNLQLFFHCLLDTSPTQCPLLQRVNFFFKYNLQWLFRAVGTGSFKNRVTRSGEFSPIGWVFTLGSFFENCRNSPHIWATLFHGYVYTLILAKM
jgi:hypothetical protein